jgi:hypothetical protein
VWYNLRNVSRKEKMFEVKQKVWCVIFGPGVVVQIHTNNTEFPVVVRFGNAVLNYTADGKYQMYARQTLYPYPVEVVKKVSKPSINWDHVRAEYKFLAQDANGNAWLYWEKPESGDDHWYATQGLCSEAESHVSYGPGTCDWKDSLVERPVVQS